MPAGSNRSRRVCETSGESKPEEEETEVDKALRKRQGKRSSSSESQGSFESFEANPHPEGETATRSNPDPKDPERRVCSSPNPQRKHQEGGRVQRRKKVKLVPTKEADKEALQSLLDRCVKDSNAGAQEERVELDNSRSS